MSKDPQTIQIFLPYGDPTDIRIAEVTTLAIQAFEVPRNSLKKFFKEQEANQVALYCLISEDENTSELMAYIGQTTSKEDRLKQQDQNKIFWDKALVFISKTDSMTSAHAKYLEWLSIKEAKDIGRYNLTENKNNPDRPPHTTPSLKADCEQTFETIKLLASTLGVHIFKPFIEKEDLTNEDNLYVYAPKNKNINAKMMRTTEGCVLLQGSKITNDKQTNNHPKKLKQLREELEKNGKIENSVLKVNIPFLSPTGAADFCCRSHVSGNKQWIHKKRNKTLGEILKEENAQQNNSKTTD